MGNRLNRMRNYRMHHKLGAKCLNDGCSAEDIKNTCKKLVAFSLGEMLVVLLIMSFLAIGIPAVQFKKSEVKTQRTLHGRYECYYACPLTTDADGTVRHLSGCADNQYSIYQYSVNEEGVATGPESVAQCVFTPPKEAIFYLVHAVGGGGGASGTNGSYSSNTRTETRTYYSPNQFPDWLKKLHGMNVLIPAQTYSVTTSGQYATINYGRSGGAGDTKSLFFPRLRNVEIEMYPGKGGARGAAGSKTEVWFNTATGRSKVIEAAGGSAGYGSGSMGIWLAGETANCAIKDNDDVGFREADFATNVEMDKGSKMTSKMEEVQFGSGGSGSYGNPPVRSVTFTVNGQNVTSHVKLDCNDPRMCADGSTSNPCPGAAGRNGAVVILW